LNLQTLEGGSRCEAAAWNKPLSVTFHLPSMHHIFVFLTAGPLPLCCSQGNEGIREQMAQGDREADAANASRVRAAKCSPAPPPVVPHPRWLASGMLLCCCLLLVPVSRLLCTRQSPATFHVLCRTGRTPTTTQPTLPRSESRRSLRVGLGCHCCFSTPAARLRPAHSNTGEGGVVQWPGAAAGCMATGG
jgi:hypothetical protein